MTPGQYMLDTCLFKEGDEYYSRNEVLLLSELGKDTDIPEGSSYGVHDY